MEEMHEINLIPLTGEEEVTIYAGSEGWDYQLARFLGKGAGYSVRKMWRLFRLMSENLYELQANTQVIYK